MNGLELIKAERQRQIEVLGYTQAHDDEHVNGEIAQAAADYAMPGQQPMPHSWAKNKGADSRMEQLVKAGALIVAEIERLQRIQSWAVSEGCIHPDSLKVDE